MSPKSSRIRKRNDFNNLQDIFAAAINATLHKCANVANISNTLVACSHVLRLKISNHTNDATN